jgi:hypothetical protein
MSDCHDYVPVNFYLHNRFWSETALKKWNYEMTGRPVWLMMAGRKMKNGEISIFKMVVSFA